MLNKGAIVPVQNVRSPGFLFQFFSCTQENSGMQTCHRSFTSEQAYPHSYFQNGDSRVHKGLPPPGSVGYFPRPVRCVFHIPMVQCTQGFLDFKF